MRAAEERDLAQGEGDVRERTGAMNSPQCLVTGCNVVDAAQRRWAHGDLHQLGGALIFNAVLGNGETNWNYGSSPPGDVPCITALSPFFERRGVIVLRSSGVTANKAALDRMNWTPPSRCRHYNAAAAPELGPDWLRCPDCGREYNARNPQLTVRIQSSER
jgi:hypothetical protein